MRIHEWLLGMTTGTLALVGIMYEPPVPVPRFTASCPTQQCLFDASASTGAVTFIWNWGQGGKPETTTVATRRNTYRAPGAYVVTLRVIDAKGVGATTIKLVTVPNTVATPPPDTTHAVIHDTVTVVRVDTLLRVVTLHDTVTVHDSASTRVDTVYALTPLSPNSFGVQLVTGKMGELYVFRDTTLAGRIVQKVTGQFSGYKAQPNSIALVWVGDFLTQLQALAALAGP